MLYFEFESETTLQYWNTLKFVYLMWIHNNMRDGTVTVPVTWDCVFSANNMAAEDLPSEFDVVILGTGTDTAVFSLHVMCPNVSLFVRWLFGLSGAELICSNVDPSCLEICHKKKFLYSKQMWSNRFKVSQRTVSVANRKNVNPLQ